MEEIPYQSLVEVPFTVRQDWSMCNEFNKISVELVSTCEQMTTNNRKRQYNSVTVSGVQYIDYETMVEKDKTLAAFSVTWPASPPQQRNLADGDNNMGKLELDEVDLEGIALSTSRLLAPQLAEHKTEVTRELATMSEKQTRIALELDDKITREFSTMSEQQTQVARVLADQQMQVTRELATITRYFVMLLTTCIFLVIASIVGFVVWLTSRDRSVGKAQPSALLPHKPENTLHV